MDGRVAASVTLLMGPTEKVIRPCIWVALPEPRSTEVKGRATSELFNVSHRYQLGG